MNSILNPTTWLYAALALVLVGGSSYLYGRGDGREIERVEWQATEMLAKDYALKEQDKSAAAAREQEQAYAAAQIAASQKYQQEIKNVATQKDRVIADLRAGAIRLRDPGRQYPTGENVLPATAAAASGCDGAAGGELSQPLSEFLVAAFSEADAITHQLTACQLDLLAAISTSNQGAAP